MFLTPDQIQMIQDSLECALNVRLDEFERCHGSGQPEALQASVRAARDAKRFYRVLSYTKQQIERVG